MKKLLGVLLMVFALTANAASTDACRINPKAPNERIVLTIEACPVTTNPDNPEFYRAYWSIEPGVVGGEACWIGDGTGVTVVFKDITENNGVFSFPATDFVSCE